jgi:hypothetical protein
LLALKVFDVGPGIAGIGRMSITEETLFVSQGGNLGASQLIAYAPSS